MPTSCTRLKASSRACLEVLEICSYPCSALLETRSNTSEISSETCSKVFSISLRMADLEGSLSRTEAGRRVSISTCSRLRTCSLGRTKALLRAASCRRTVAPFMIVYVNIVEGVVGRTTIYQAERRSSKAAIEYRHRRDDAFSGLYWPVRPLTPPPRLHAQHLFTTTPTGIQTQRYKRLLSIQSKL